MFTLWKERMAAWPAQKWMFAAWAFLLLLSFSIGAAKEWYFLAGVPLVFLLIFISVVDYKRVFLLLLACIPLSTEIVLPNGFGTDLPTEPLTVGLMLVALLIFLSRWPRLNSLPFRHPITCLLLAHVFWVYFSTIQSDLFLVSLKFSLAKTWYVVVFYFLAMYLIRNEQDFKQVFWWIFWPLVFSVAVIMVRHAGYGFAFDRVHEVLHPFQRNHVNYSGTLALFIPFTWYALGGMRRYSGRWWWLLGVIAWLLVAVYLTYTRAAYLALVFALLAYFVFRLRLIRVFLVAGIIGVIFLATYMFSGSRYLDYTPNYDTTVMHDEFGSLLEATAKGEDISTMERVYRWVAASQMTRESPFFGFGPGNFVNFYHSYAVNSFRTYVSRNEEQSGVHSYFLLMLVEQGWPGLILFLILSIYTLTHGEGVYHRTKDPGRKRVVMTVLLSLVVIDAFLIVNDMLETDKMGSFYFLCLAVLVRMDMLNQKESGHEADSGKNG